MCISCLPPTDDLYLTDDQLQYLPYKQVKLYCIVSGCKGFAKVRDYGLYPVLYWPSKNGKRWHDEKERSNWFNVFIHYRTCSKHYKQPKVMHPTDQELKEIIERTIIF